MNTKKYAKSIDRAIYTAEYRNKIARPYRSVYNPTAVLAAREDLTVISKALREDRANAKVLAGVHDLLTRGVDSPLFRDDPNAARKAVAKLRSELPA